MKTNKIVLLITLFGCLVFPTMAQESEGSAVLSKMIANYTVTDDFALEMQYTLYKGFKKDSISEQYTATTVKKDALMKMSMSDYTMYVYKDLQLTVDPSAKSLYVNPKSLNSDPMAMVNQVSLMKTTYDIEVISKTNGVIKLSLTPKLEVMMPYSKIEVALSAKEYKMLSQTLYYSQPIPFKDAKGQVTSDDACLEVKLKELSLPKESIPAMSEFIIGSSASNNLRLAPKYATYQLIDQRKND